MSKVNIEDFLLEVERPARYIGNEYNSIRKDWANTDVKVALAFPDIYEIGMSNLGLKILYHIINSRPGALAERVYSPWVDMEKALTDRHLPLFSLESKTPLKEFDIIGFTLQYEMSYTNVLNMMRMSQIPLKSADRMTGKYPLIIAGGPCAFNPEPMTEFIDAFIIGDGEEVITEIIEVYKKNKFLAKKELLLALAAIAGVYVPMFYGICYEPAYTLKPLENSLPLKIKKRFVHLEDVPYPTEGLVPNMDIVHNRGIMEVMRGCVRNCRFCQATMIYRPARVRSSEKVLRLIDEILCHTGFEEISLSSLSTSDYPEIYSLASHLVEKYEKEKVSLSLPSLRADAFSVTLANMVQQVRKSGLTFAPEAGTERLRKIINKDLSDEQLLAGIKAAYQSGWKTIKLYFMIGLPYETQEDIEGIVQLVRRIKALYRGLVLNLAISAFVPKPFSVFQWHGQESISTLREKQKYLLKAVPAKVKMPMLELSYLEAVFARGDRRLSAVLEQAVIDGCHFDQWRDQFAFHKWQDVFAKKNIDPDYYAHRRIPFSETLPWEHVDCGVSKEFLSQEYIKAQKEEATPDCQQLCAVCGIENCHIDIFQKSPSLHQTVSGTRHLKTLLSPVQKVRFKYYKEKAMRFISHLDLIEMFIRAMRRADIPLAYSQGFNAHPKIAFGPPLPVGFESITECADIELTKRIDLSTMVKKVNRQLPEGLQVTEMRELTVPQPSLMSQVTGARYSVRVEGGFKNEQYPGMVVVGREARHCELLLDLPLGQKNVRPEKVCAEIFLPGFSIKQVKRIGLFSSMDHKKECFII